MSLLTKGQISGRDTALRPGLDGLSYVVQDGFFMIDSRTGIVESRLDEVDRKLDRIISALERRNPPQ